VLIQNVAIGASTSTKGTPPKSTDMRQPQLSVPSDGPAAAANSSSGSVSSSKQQQQPVLKASRQHLEHQDRFVNSTVATN
jgi:hypothetical protein